MRPEDVMTACLNSIQGCANSAFTPKITLKLPENRRCPKQRKLLGRTGPKGDVVAWGFDGYDTVIFDAKEVLSYLINSVNEEK